MELEQRWIGRFWSRIEVKEENECWEWIGCKVKGYGWIHFQKNKISKNYQAHRLSWILTNGDIPEGLCVCHKCDNRSCCNPNHLFLGTRKDNSDDMISKNRQNHPRKLTKEQENNIKEKYDTKLYTMRELAKEYNVDSGHISHIINGKNKNNRQYLTENEIFEIKEKYNSGLYSQQKIAVEHSMNQTSISRIVLGKTKRPWKQV